MELYSVHEARMGAVHCTGGYCRIGTVYEALMGTAFEDTLMTVCLQARPVVLGQKAIREVYSYSRTRSINCVIPAPPPLFLSQ